jgi:phosphorylcholine metabolism protein LicD
VAPVAQRGGGRGARAAGARGAASAEGPKKPLSKDALDAELDSYMLQTPESAKSYLDQQLEDYMRSREKEASA